MRVSPSPKKVRRPRVLKPHGLHGARALTLYRAFQQSNDVMFYCDRNGVILDVNDAFVRHYGYTRREAVGKTPRIIRSPRTRQEAYAKMWSAILDPRVGYWRGELVNRRKDGSEVPVHLTITSVRDDEGQIVAYVSNALDMTEQKAMQARMAQAEALATLGEMAAVVAHEIRNPLGSIVMAAGQLADDKLDEKDRELVLRVLRDEGSRLNRTLTNFLAYARPSRPQLQASDLNGLAEEAARALRSNQELRRGLKLKLSLDPRLPPVPIDADQVRQVLWNLVLNAVQAMEKGGSLLLGTGRLEGWAYLRVRDSGPGIPAADHAQIFKPFHTTKRQGTGLGLAIAERIIKSHGGRIELDSEPGKGADFRILLPLA